MFLCGGGTLLDPLESKGLVTSDRSELAFSPSRDLLAGSPPAAALEPGHNLSGEPGLLVLHLLKSHPLDAGQAKEVRAVLDNDLRNPKKAKITVFPAPAPPREGWP